MCQEHKPRANFPLAGQEFLSAPLSFPHSIAERLFSFYAMQPNLFSTHVKPKARAGKVRFVTWPLTFPSFQPFAVNLWLNRNIWLTPRVNLCAESPSS
jgi:hypothetical protein